MRKKQHPDQWTRDRLQPENHFITRWGIIVKDVICNIYAFIRRIQLLYFMYIIYFGWVVYNIIPDVSINVQTREIHNFTQGTSVVRHLLLEWRRKSVNRTKHNMNETLEHYLVCERSCLGHIDRFLFFIFFISNSGCLSVKTTTPMIPCFLCFLFDWETTSHITDILCFWRNTLPLQEISKMYLVSCQRIRWQHGFIHCK